MGVYAQDVCAMVVGRMHKYMNCVYAYPSCVYAPRCACIVWLAKSLLVLLTQFHLTKLDGSDA